MIAADNDSLQECHEAEALEALARLEDKRLFRERLAALVDACDDRRKERMIEQMLENDK